ncbi:organoarsenical effux MFS transporter ArsJ [Paremcibacter congregatus]|uniref:MFS transporter n=1 Tax=Paremcibacter congregatus TaxID=2043170 RepID=A0A2G4YPU9_9PROT|nr:organoarsenical effux MFS transporter ArsJ [Paremcibacter congregatus]PHZ83486.1 MFS transporter [Paremcibacter congregatus]QDE28047.1 organoarsenical effux MFS transporter ArsJ [Paremcibacter congregatus]
MTQINRIDHQKSLPQYALVTAAYWGFTLTDGALRMLVLLHFHTLGYTPLQLASLFLLYEIFGIVTNITGGWLGSRVGLNKTLILGLGLQIVALMALTLLDDSWPLVTAVPFVVAVQGLSGIAKDLTKMSAKSALKLIIPADQNATLFKWVALLTGSKNTLKGVGFFLGGLLLSLLGFAPALWTMVGLLIIILTAAMLFLSPDLGQAQKKVTFRQLFSKSHAINLLSTARFFLFGARDVWFVVGLPLFLYEGLGWDFAEVGGVMALWVIGYGLVQSAAPLLLRKSADGRSREVIENRLWVFLLTTLPFIIVAGLETGMPPALTILTGLGLFGMVFAVNSALHSYLILAFTPSDHVAVNVGFYYSANAGGRLLGTLLSGSLYQWGGLTACLIGSGVMLTLAFFFSLGLPTGKHSQ